jgi:hypothetical protein
VDGWDPTGLVGNIDEESDFAFGDSEEKLETLSSRRG